MRGQVIFDGATTKSYTTKRHQRFGVLYNGRRVWLTARLYDAMVITAINAMYRTRHGWAMFAQDPPAATVTLSQLRAEIRTQLGCQDAPVVVTKGYVPVLDSGRVAFRKLRTGTPHHIEQAVNDAVYRTGLKVGVLGQGVTPDRCPTSPVGA